MALHQFDEMHIQEDCSTLSGDHDNGLFFDCTFQKLKGLSLTNCDLNGSKFRTQSVRDALGFALTLGCKSFRNVEFSELLFDLFLTLATMTKGNDVKRKQLISIIGPTRHNTLMRVAGAIE